MAIHMEHMIYNSKVARLIDNSVQTLYFYFSSEDR